MRGRNSKPLLPQISQPQDWLNETVWTKYNTNISSLLTILYAAYRHFRVIYHRRTSYLGQGKPRRSRRPSRGEIAHGKLGHLHGSEHSDLPDSWGSVPKMARREPNLWLFGYCRLAAILTGVLLSVERVCSAAWSGASSPSLALSYLQLLLTRSSLQWQYGGQRRVAVTAHRAVHRSMLLDAASTLIMAAESSSCASILMQTVERFLTRDRMGGKVTCVVFPGPQPRSWKVVIHGQACWEGRVFRSWVLPLNVRVQRGRIFIPSIYRSNRIDIHAIQFYFPPNTDMRTRMNDRGIRQLIFCSIRLILLREWWRMSD